VAPHIHRPAYRGPFVSCSFSATLEHGQAVLRFPYDDRLRVLLRAIPGRRWDPSERAWLVPIDEDRAEALARLFASLPGEPQVSRSLARAIDRHRRRRRHTSECVLDLARPDDRWWLTLPSDAPAELVQELTEHPHAYTLPAIGRILLPLDDHTRRLLDHLPPPAAARLRLSEDAEHALTELRRNLHPEPHTLAARRPDPVSPTNPAGAARAARERVRDAAVRRRPPWRGTVEVAGEEGQPVFLLLGNPELLPDPVRPHATSAPGGASLPLDLRSWKLVEEELHGWVTSAASHCVAALLEGRPAPSAVLELSRVHHEPTFVLAPGHDTDQLDRFAALPGARPGAHPRAGARPGGRTGVSRTAPAGDEHDRLPAITADPFCVPALDRFILDHSTWVAPDALVVLQDIREQHSRAEGLVALSAASHAALEVPGLGGELKPFQRAGVSYLLAQRRSFLADEQGLGKTIEALATLQADDAFPAIVVSPASLKLNWLREIERWLPTRTAHALVGTASPGPAHTPDITVVNYDILAPRLAELEALGPRALVLDESHYCKNPSAKRTQAVARLADAIPRECLVLALTGTPVMNRPPELVSQLRIIGRLADFGSGAQFGRRFRGPDAHMRLHWHLRARCFVRRLKVDVLPQLPPKTRSIVPVELDNQHEYRLAERDLVAWLRTQPMDLRELDAKVASALRAERLVRLNALKLLAARGKLHAALAWIHDFCASGEPLVVFARHREIQRAVLHRFPRALHILGEDTHRARDASLRAFQEPDDVPRDGSRRRRSGETRLNEARSNQLIVCSLEVAGQGLTLTRASNVAFLELDWTPAKHDQAEDRCHRIGQHDAVTAHYLLAAATVDETIATLLERKRAVIAAVTDGAHHDEEAVVDALVRELAAEPFRPLRAVA
jgi:SWI/SNF-related matrix-associated actin-dependent regulator of chromatin subfamily A-like protein 1